MRGLERIDQYCSHGPAGPISYEIRYNQVAKLVKASIKRWRLFPNRSNFRGYGFTATARNSVMVDAGSTGSMISQRVDVSVFVATGSQGEPSADLSSTAV